MGFVLNSRSNILALPNFSPTEHTDFKLKPFVSNEKHGHG